MKSASSAGLFLKILALDTSAERCSVALAIDHHLFEREEEAPNLHSEIILDLVAEVLSDAGVPLAGLDGIAFGAGPGSFTGLRIGCGVAQGLAFGASLPVAGISTLAALARRAGGERIVACLDARMGEVYLAAYEHSSPILAPGLYSPASLPLLPPGRWEGAGSGFDLYREEFLRAYPGIEGAGGLFPRAREIASLAAIEFAAGRGVDPALAHPVYIRDKVAKKESER